MTSLPLGTDTEAILLPASNDNPRGFQIVTHNPTDNFIPVEAFLYLIPFISQSHQSRAYLTNPGSDWGKYSIVPPWFKDTEES